MNTGSRIVILRRITLGLVFAAVIVSLAFDSGLGTPSAFGIGEFFLLCPLGGLEAMIASKSFIPVAAISLSVVLIFTLIFGRAWCAWGCPAPAIRSFFKRQPVSEGSSEAEALENPRPSSACTSCASSRQKKASFKEILSFMFQDRRKWVLAGVLLVTLIVGLPVFCLICPIGLTFGTVSSLWHLFVDKQVTASVVVFPLCLVIELLVYRKWCINLCPIGGLLSIFGQGAKLFRPRVDAKECLLYTTDKKCNVCTKVCAEDINMHTEGAVQALGECTRCGECLKHCPTQAIAIELAPADPVIDK